MFGSLQIVPAPAYSLKIASKQVAGSLCVPLCAPVRSLCAPVRPCAAPVRPCAAPVVPLPIRILHVCTFYKFLHVFIFSKIKLNLIEGVMSAVLRQPSRVFPHTLYLMVLAFSLKQTKCGKTWKNTEFQNPDSRRGAGVSPGSFRVLFFGS